MTTNNTEVLNAMLHARTELVMLYLNYVELLSTRLLAQTNVSKTACDCSFGERDCEFIKSRLIKSVEAYNRYFCNSNYVTRIVEQELTERAMEDAIALVKSVETFSYSTSD